MCLVTSHTFKLASCGLQDHNSVYMDNVRKNKRSHHLYLLGRNALRMARPVLSAQRRKCFKAAGARHIHIAPDQSRENQTGHGSGAVQGGNWGTRIRMGLTEPFGVFHISTGREDHEHVWAFTQL